MPNWVYTNMNVRGDKEQLKEFSNLISTKPFFVPEDDWKEEHTRFSFHSFITPPEDKYDEYHSENGSGPNGPYGNTEYNWYNWNISNWDTKWDACNPGVHRWLDDDQELKGIDISFETAWGAPGSIFLAMAEKFPKLSFSIWWEEEQGFGAELSASNGDVVVDREWDIPSCHQDFVDQDKECHCETEDDQDYWFSDCPRKKKKQYVVATVTRRVITAESAEVAIEAAKAEEGGYDLPDSVEVTETSYADSYEVLEEIEIDNE